MRALLAVIYSWLCRSGSLELRSITATLHSYTQRVGSTCVGVVFIQRAPQTTGFNTHQVQCTPVFVELFSVNVSCNYLAFYCVP